MELLDLLTSKRLIPLFTVKTMDSLDDIVKCLIKADLPIVEIAYRSDLAGEAIRYIHEKFPSFYVGAGTVLNAAQASEAINNGAKFVISPGLLEEVADYCAERGIPYFPGVSTSSEIMLALKHQLTVLKFFPSEMLGGIAMIKALKGPFAQVKFLPSGGVEKDNYRDYLKQDNILAVGGSFILDKQLIAEKNWDGLTEHLKQL